MAMQAAVAIGDAVLLESKWRAKTEASQTQSARWACPTNHFGLFLTRKGYFNFAGYLK